MQVYSGTKQILADQCCFLLSLKSGLIWHHHVIEGDSTNLEIFLKIQKSLF